MKLVPKGWDEYNPVVILVGALFTIGGGYGLALMGVSGPPVLWLIRGVPAAFVAIGSIIVFTQLRLRSK